MKKRKRANIYTAYNRFSLISVVVTVTLVGTAVFTLINMVFNYVFLPENNLFQVLAATLSGPIAFVSFWVTVYRRTGVLNFGSGIMEKNIRYLGIRTTQSTGRKHFSACADEKQIKPSSTIMGWLACSSKWGGKTNLHKRFYVANHDVCIDLPNNHFVANQILYVLKQEKKIIRVLKREKSYDKALFVSGLPLATYLLLCSEYNDCEKRALILKRNKVLPLRAYLLNKIAGTAEGLEELSELPNRWLYEATGYEYETTTKSSY